MENQKNNTPIPPETDFFAEALKAFDAPSTPVVQQPQPEPKPEEKVETAVSQPPKPRFWQKWWPAVLCCAVCAVLLLSFLPGLIKSQYRGENWVYGTLVAVDEDSLVLTDLSGTNWLVELGNLEPPKGAKGGIWVFYNGNPQYYRSPDTEKYHCSQKITASTIRTPRWYSVAEYADYGLIADEIDFDLDGDGKKEHWLIHRYDVYDGMDIPINHVYRLAALDEVGDLKYYAAFMPPTIGSYIFSDQGGNLSLISTSPDQTLQIRLENGSIVVYHGGTNLSTSQPIETLPPTSPTEPLPTRPNIDEPTEYYLHFYFGGESEERKKLDPAYGASLKKELDGLFWTQDRNHNREIAGSFWLATDKKNYIYEFTYDGKLLHDGQVATMLWPKLITLMGNNVPEDTYSAIDNKGAQVTLEFTGINKFNLTYEQPVSDGVHTITNDGLCGSVGNLLFLYLDGSNSGIFVFEYQNYRLMYRKDLSKQYLAQLDDQALFHNKLDPLGISFRFYHTAASKEWDSQYPAEANWHQLTFDQMDKLKRAISELEFEKLAETGNLNVLGGFTLHENDTDSQYYYTDTGLLLTADSAAVMTDHLSNYLQILMLSASEDLDAQYMTEDRNGAPVQLKLYSANKQFVLEHAGGMQTPGADFGETWGQYVLFGKSLRLYPSNGCTDFIQLWLQDNGDLVYVDKMTETVVDHRLRDAAAFKSIRAFNYAQIEMNIDVNGNGGYTAVGSKVIEVPHDLLYQVSKLESSLPWAKHYGEITYVKMGHIAFLDGEETHLQFHIISGKQLERDGWTASISNKQWELVVQLMICAGEGPMPGSYTTEAADLQLYLREDNRFTMTDGYTEEAKTIEGYYVTAEDAVLFYGDDGQCFVMWKNADGSLNFNAYNSALHLWDLPNGLTFREYTEIT